MPTFADSNRASLRFVEESTTNWGVTPTSGTSKEMRITSSSLAAAKETVISDELRSDRMVGSVAETGASTAGDINFEFSAGAQDDFIEQFLQGNYTRDLSFQKFEGSSVAITGATTITIAGGNFVDYFSTPAIIRLSGFLGSANNDYATVIGTAFASGVTTLTITGPTLVAEVGNSKGKVQLATDVVDYRDTTISSSNAGSSFDSSGTPWTGLEAAGTLVIGQKINVTGLGHGTGTYTVTTTPLEGDRITLTDGAGNAVVFEFDVSANGVATGNVAILADDTPSVTVLAARIASAINAQANAGSFKLSAASAIGVVTVKNLADGGSEVLTDNTTGIAVVDFSGQDDTAHGVFTIVSISTNKLVVSPAPGTVSAGTAVTLQASMLRNPNGASGGTLAHELLVAQSSTIETSFLDVGQYFTHDGMRVGSYSLSVATGAIVTGTLGFQGRETVRSITEKLTNSGNYTVLAAPTNQVMNATTNVGSLELNGAALATAIQSIELSGEASLRNQNGVGSKFPSGIGTGRFNLTGSVVAYFATAALYNAFINHDTVSLSFSFTDLDDNAYYYTLPALKFTADPISPTGIDTDVMENLEFVAFRDAATACMLQIDRFSNVTPAGSHA